MYWLQAEDQALAGPPLPFQGPPPGPRPPGPTPPWPLLKPPGPGQTPVNAVGVGGQKAAGRCAERGVEGKERGQIPGAETVYTPVDPAALQEDQPEQRDEDSEL